MGQQQQMCMPPQCGMNMQQGLAPQMMRHPQARQGHHRGDMLKKMQEDLNLTDEQVLAMKELRKTMAQKRKEALKKAMEAIKTQDDAELKKILTEEQYKEFTEKREKMRAHVKERFGKGNRDGKFAPPPFPCEEDEA
jgi:Spy/CpxP family protein refolding chaperone